MKIIWYKCHFQSINSLIWFSRFITFNISHLTHNTAINGNARLSIPHSSHQKICFESSIEPSLRNKLSVNIHLECNAARSSWQCLLAGCTSRNHKWLKININWRSCMLYYCSRHFTGSTHFELVLIWTISMISQITLVICSCHVYSNLSFTFSLMPHNFVINYLWYFGK